MTKEVLAYLWGMLGVCGFGLTLPATKAAVPLFGVVTVGIGRAVLAGILGLILLIITKSKIPNPKQIGGLIVVALGVIFGFPLFSAYAMKYLPASHGAIVVAILPLLTALFGNLLAGEKPSKGYWIAASIGSLAIAGYAINIGGGTLHLADLALLLAAIAAAIGYAQGAKLAREIGSWRTICYALVIVLPVTIPLSIACLEFNPVPNPIAAWIGFFYVSFISMFLAFFAWYKGMSMGGIAKIGQLQLLQPFVTIFASAILFAEKLTASMSVVLAIVLLSVYFGQRSLSLQRKSLR
jgi:drug/metabolite transporter (DMT)-like permease